MFSKKPANVASSDRSVSAKGISLSIPNEAIDISDDYPQAVIAQGDNAKKLYVVVYSYSMADIATGTTLDAFAMKAYKTFQDTESFTNQSRVVLPAGKITNPQNLTVLDCKIDAAHDLQNYVYYERYIKTAQGYYIISAWTTGGKLTENEAAIKKLIASFREV